jgi:hypothetical protein
MTFVSLTLFIDTDSNSYLAGASNLTSKSLSPFEFEMAFFEKTAVGFRSLFPSLSTLFSIRSLE